MDGSWHVICRDWHNKLGGKLHASFVVTKILFHRPLVFVLVLYEYYYFRTLEKPKEHTWVIGLW